MPSSARPSAIWGIRSSRGHPGRPWHAGAPRRRPQPLFRAGSPPKSPLNGRYAGRLVRVQLFPPVTQGVRGNSILWIPWKGKAFSASEQTGINIFAKSSLLATHIPWPFYRGIRTDTDKTYDAFAFRT